MRLSEAILLGAVDSIGRIRGDFFDRAGHRCALGDALHAVGQMPADKMDGFSAVTHQWPWIKELGEYPCQCDTAGDRSTKRYIISHLNDVHVVTDADWTLEQLVDYVRSIEPPEMGLTRPEPCAVEMLDKLSETGSELSKKGSQ